MKFSTIPAIPCSRLGPDTLEPETLLSSDLSHLSPQQQGHAVWFQGGGFFLFLRSEVDLFREKHTTDRVWPISEGESGLNTGHGWFLRAG